MSKDVKMFVLCNHIVDNEIYAPSVCPKCYGKGYYFDIFFDEFGKPVLSEGAAKLQQELLKIVIEDKGGNVFHKDWGCSATSNIGVKNTSVKKSKIELLIRDSIEYLKSIQEGNQLYFQNMSDDEIIGSIESIEVTPDGPMGYSIHVVIRSKSGELVAYSIDI